MASKVASQDGFGPVLAALATMQSNSSRQEKSQAHEFLEQFQKSVCEPDRRVTQSRLTTYTSQKHGISRTPFSKVPIPLWKPGYLLQQR
jgi:hypothetical protein